MEPEVTESAGSKKKIFIITLAVILVAGGVALGYLFMQKDTPEQVEPASVTVTAPVVTPPRVYTDAEKRQALEDFAKQNPTNTTTEAEKLSALRIYSTQTHTPVLSEDEKRKALEDFSTQAKLAQ